MRAAIAAESAGIPSVSVLCEGFAGQASATARGLGWDGLALAMTVGHVDAQDRDEMVGHFVETTIPQIVAGLVSPTGEQEYDASSKEPTALEIVASGDLDTIHDVFIDRGWSDGTTFAPPTEARVERFLGASGHDPWKRLGVAPSSGRDVTIWSIAVNAVMAGCRPEHLPVLIAIAEILLDPGYGAEHSGNTTGADALILLDGPSAAPLGFSAGPGAQREGTPANTAVGRWLRLYLRNVFGFTADELDKATFGNPARPVLGQDRRCLRELGWPSIGEQMGHGPDEDVVTLARMNSGVLIGSVTGSVAEEIIPYLADGIARSASWDLTHVHGLGSDQFSPLLVVSPLIARTLHRDGRTFEEVQLHLFENARITARSFERYIGEWSNLTPGRPQLAELARSGVVPPIYGESDDPDRYVPVATRPERIRIAVAGDPNRANAYAFANDGPHGWWTSARIDHTPASDLACRIGDTDCR